MTEFDVAVIGAGPAGAATALALATAGRSVIVLERSDFNDFRAGEVLTPDICPTLVQLGVWERFLTSGFQTAHGIWSAWGDPALVPKDFILSPYGPAWIVNRSRFDHMLAKASQDSGARLELSVRQLEFERLCQCWRISAQRGRQAISIHARFLVDASGRASIVARSVGERWRRHNTLLALIAVLERPARLVPDNVVPDNVLLVESTPHSWWYSAFTSNSRLVVTCLTDADLVRRCASPEEFWAGSFAKSEFTRIRAAGFSRQALYVRSAASGCLDCAVGSGWLAVGDAASAFDPLSGMGILKALRSAVLAATAVDGGLAGNVDALITYAKRTRNEFRASMRTSAQYYGIERRWPESPFWERRHSSTAPVRE